jgi:hypothetical protein
MGWVSRILTGTLLAQVSFVDLADRSQLTSVLPRVLLPLEGWGPASWYP